MEDLSKYKGTLPYASELFGVYQPLLGWRSRRIRGRIAKARAALYQSVVTRMVDRAKPPVTVSLADRADATAPLGAVRGVNVTNLRPYIANGSRPAAVLDSAVTRLMGAQIGTGSNVDWSTLAGPEQVSALLGRVEQAVSSSTQAARDPEVATYVAGVLGNVQPADRPAVLQRMFEREAAMAGFISFLAQHSPSSLDAMFVHQTSGTLAETLALEDPLLSFGANNMEAILSPIGLIHLYREYFFEFDSFLGPAVGHVWLSPGGTVELIEISTRKTLTERSFEALTETTTSSERSVTTQDELSEAIKDENRDNVKFGFTNEAHLSTPWVQDTATASFSLDKAKVQTRETTHKQMRQQSEKLASQIKQSFKTTFKTSTEVTDTTSKRYVLQNTGGSLVNYELRRKMRKVGVQVQDIGTQLCWHTFVDDPARQLGISKLVHIATPPDLGDLGQPKQLEVPIPFKETKPLTIPFVSDRDERDVAYDQGEETVSSGEVDVHVSTIQWQFPIAVATDKPNFRLTDVSVTAAEGSEVSASAHSLASDDGSSKGTFVVYLDHVNFQNSANVGVNALLTWTPKQSYVDEITNKNDAAVGDFTNEERRRSLEAFYNAARERVKLASKIEPRPGDDLREEERTVVYRTLIDQLLRVGTFESKHVVSELIRSIFDVDKMLYFVAPEWWRPQQHHSAQHLGEPEVAPSAGGGASPGGGNSLVSKLLDPALLVTVPAASLGSISAVVQAQPTEHVTAIPATDVVDWGGAKELGRDNYYITEDSAPAKLGSSLGWLLQLDGDDFRNAFLNAPWVKAVIPIRPGKEEAAINWLKQAQVEGSDGLDANYVAADGDPKELSDSQKQVKVSDALDYLISKVREYNKSTATQVAAGPNPADAEDPRNHFAGSLPTEAVFEHGFYPLKGGIKFDQDGTEQAFISQWMEILPTDQVVALQVEYDPKTLQLKVP